MTHGLGVVSVNVQRAVVLGDSSRQVAAPCVISRNAIVLYFSTAAITYYWTINFHD